jgi:hypothetical protein
MVQTGSYSRQPLPLLVDWQDGVQDQEPCIHGLGVLGPGHC